MRPGATEEQVRETLLLAICLLIVLATVLAGAIMIGLVVSHLETMIGS